MSVSSITHTDLLILGLLVDRPMHGYELYQQIKTEEIDAWFQISMAGVYYSLGKLRDKGLVSESSLRGGRSARRSIYRLTEEGRTAFFEAMEIQAASRERIYLDYDLVIYLLNRLPVRQAVSLLEQRQAFLAEQSREMEVALEAERNRGQSPQRLAVLDHKHRYLEMERNWLAAVIGGIRGKDDDVRAGEGGGIMSFSGNLRRQHLPDLIRLLTSGQHSGRLAVTDGVVTCTLGFDRGQPTGAARQRRGEPPATPTPEEALEVVYELFQWREGRFTLDQERPCEEWCVPLDLSAESLILAGCRRVDDWATIQRLVPSADTAFELGTAAQHLDNLALTPAEERILVAVDGIKSVATIAGESDLTIFAASRALYGLAAIDVVRAASVDKIRLRRVFREFAELLCRSTLTWRTSEEDTCEQQVNERCQHLPLRLNRGRIEDRVEPQTRTEDMVEMYRHFLLMQLDVIGQRFGREKAHQWFDQTLVRLSPELQKVAKRHGFDMLSQA